MRISAMLAVPSIWFESGTDFIDRAEGWGEERHTEWIRNAANTPSGEVSDARVLDGLRDGARLAYRFGLTIASADEMPGGYPRDDFEGEREQALAELAE